jgi:ubiquinone/menaquinone biosynthesis C-methylase UbiE
MLMCQQESWQLAGSGPAQYERYQVPSLFQPLAERLLATIPLRTGERVLDVACGTGIVARLAAQPIGRTGLVTGVDLNPGMLEVARAHTPTSGAAVDWREGDAGALPCDDESYDVVLCQQGLQFFPDQPRALREMHRVLRPGGRVALSVWRSLEHNPFNQAVAAGLARHVGAEAAASIRAPFAHGDAQALRTLIADAGFHGVEIQVQVLHRRMLPPDASIPGYLASTPMAQTVGALAAEVRTALLRDIGEALQRYRHPEGLVIPQETHLVLASK